MNPGDVWVRVELTCSPPCVLLQSSAALLKKFCPLWKRRASACTCSLMHAAPMAFGASLRPSHRHLMKRCLHHSGLMLHTTAQRCISTHLEPPVTKYTDVTGFLDKTRFTRNTPTRENREEALPQLLALITGDNGKGSWVMWTRFGQMNGPGLIFFTVWSIMLVNFLQDGFRSTTGPWSQQHLNGFKISVARMFMCIYLGTRFVFLWL